MNRRQGFTLIEIMIVLAIISILAAVSLPAIYSQVIRAKEEAVRKEMENFKNALIGNPKLVDSGIRTDFGYLGDIGTLPDNPADLNKLLKKDGSPDWTQPSWALDSFLRIGAGWKGPYITKTFTDENSLFNIDAWGNEYIYDITDYTNSKGDIVDAKIQSLGPDEAPNSDDDIIVEILKSETTATVAGFLNLSDNKPLADTPVSIHYPKDGKITSQTKVTDVNGYYRFDDIPFGIRSVTLGAGSGLSYVSNSAATSGNGQNVTFSIQNISASDVTLTSLKAEYPAFDFYEEVWVGGSKVFSRSNPRIGSGETVNFTQSFTLSGGGLAQAPTTVYVSKPTMQVPTIVVAKADTGLNTAMVELNKFNNKISGAGKAADMRGVPFAVTLSDGSIIQFTAP